MHFRRLFKGAYGPLLALAALVGVLWAGSYRSIAHLKLPAAPGATGWEVTSYRGVLASALISDLPFGADARFRAQRDNEQLAATWDEHHWSTGGIAGMAFEESQIWITDAEGSRVSRHWRSFNIPYWLLTLIAGLAPLHGVYIIVRAHRRATHNQCADCGYDLGDGEMCQACAARATLIGA